MTEVSGVAYRGVRERVTALVRTLDPAAETTPVPATPAWSVHDLLAHRRSTWAAVHASVDTPGSAAGRRGRAGRSGRRLARARPAQRRRRAGRARSAAVTVAFDWLCGARDHGGLPALRVTTEADDRIVGVGAPVATVAESRSELVRASTGRRTPDEVRAYRWDRPADPGLLLAAPLFTLRDVSLGER